MDTERIAEERIAEEGARELAATMQTTERLAPAETTAPAAERTMGSRAHVLEGTREHARRALVRITLGGVLAGVAIGLVVLGVLR